MESRAEAWDTISLHVFRVLVLFWLQNSQLTQQLQIMWVSRLRVESGLSRWFRPSTQGYWMNEEK